MSEVMTRLVTGCENFYVAERTIGADGKVTFGTPREIGGLVSITATNNYSEGNKYASNLKIKEVKKLNSVTLGVTLSDLSLEDEAFIMGNSYENGELVANAEDRQKSLAVLFNLTRDDGSKVYYVYYNAKLAKDSSEGGTETDSIEFKDVVLNGTALPDKNKDIFYSIDTADENHDATKVENWFTTVQTKTVTP